MMKAKSAIFVLLLLVAGTYAQDGRPPVNVENTALDARLDIYLRPFVTTNNFSGVIFIARGDRILYQRQGIAQPGVGREDPQLAAHGLQRPQPGPGPDKDGG